MKKLYFILAFLALALAAGAKTYSIRDIPNVHLVDSTRFVSNPDGILSPAAVSELDNTLRAVMRQTTVEPVVVMVDDIDGSDIDTFATDLYEYWGLGKKDKDNGVLLLVSRDMRRAAIRTGYGIEGVLPDIIAGRILRNVMFPRFKENDYDGGTIAAVNEISQILTNPEYANELQSQYANNSSTDDETSFWSFILGYAGLALVVAIFCLIIILMIYNKEKSNPVQCYHSLLKWKLPMAFVTGMGLGVPIISYLVLKRLLSNLRYKPRRCPQCNAEMTKLDEQSDNAYLNTAQDLEEKLNSVDYDVWLCPKCGERDVLQFINPNSNYKQCPNCRAHTYHQYMDRTIVQPTQYRTGKGVKSYYCEHCRLRKDKQYVIPRKPDDAAVAGAVLGSMIGGRGGGFGGGGFGGGSFGGGHTGGGGASGGW